MSMYRHIRTILVTIVALFLSSSSVWATPYINTSRLDTLVINIPETLEAAVDTLIEHQLEESQRAFGN